MIQKPEIQLSRIKKEIDFFRPNKRILVSVPKSAGDVFLSTSLLESLQENHPDFDIYFACEPQYKQILHKNPFIYKTINYEPIMQNWADMEGNGLWYGFFDISLFLPIFTQKLGGFTHNYLDNIAFNLRK